MIVSYFKIALRNLRTGTWYSALNIGGLAMVLAVSLLLFWWVKDELSFDRFHPEAGSVYLVNAHFGKGADESTFTSTPMPLAIGAGQLPEVEAATRIGDCPGGTYQVQGKTFTERGNVAYADTNFLDVFGGFELTAGNRARPFGAPNAVIISQKLAERFFGTTDVIGKTFKNTDTGDVFVVGAVMKTPPDNSSLRFDLYIHMNARKDDSPRQLRDQNWDDFGFETYLKLNRQAAPATIGKKLTAIQAASVQAKDRPTYDLQPITEVHLYPVDGNASAAQEVNMLGAVALLLLSIGCINYVNLATARATRRCKEIGVRKVVGAGTGQLAGQLLVESMLTLTLSLILSIMLVQALLPFYSNITGKSGHFSLADPAAWQIMSGALLFCFVLAGIYPALLVSGFNPVDALRGRSGKVSGAGLRRALVVVQFMLATTLIAGTLVIGSQLRYIRERDPGFNRQHVFTFNGRHFTARFKEALAARAGISGVSTSTDTPVNVQTGTASCDWDGKEKNRTLIFAQVGVDADFIPNYEIKMLMGSNFSGGATDSTHYILNETAVKQTGLTDPVGKRFSLDGGQGIIIGIVRDFNITTIREPIMPIVIYSNLKRNNVVNVHTTGRNAPAAIALAEKLWKQYLPQYPFEYSFVDQGYQQLYQAEQQTGKLFNFFAGIAILISCLGLLGLASFITEQRTKEIGIRKVLGATVLHITGLLSKDFIKLVIIAIVIASPVSWLIVNRWLENFAYKVHITWWVFLLAGLVAIIVAVFTISFQTIRIASVNPAKVMKAE